jgi:hypothetical protein
MKFSAVVPEPARFVYGNCTVDYCITAGSNVGCSQGAPELQ